MSGLDVEALLESTAGPSKKYPDSFKHPAHSVSRNDRRDRHESNHGSGHAARDDKHSIRSRDKLQDDRNGEQAKDLNDVNGDKNNAHGSRRSSDSRDNRDSRDARDTRDSRDHRDNHDNRDNRDNDRSSYSRRSREMSYRSSTGDYYRGSTRPRTRSRSRSRSPDTRYRPGSGRSHHGRDDRDRFRERDRERDRRNGDGARRRSASPGERKTKSPPKSPKVNDDDRDKRTVFVQQLANRLRTSDLKAFFKEKAGPVVEAQIVKDRQSGRSKGVGYVEFESEESLQPALQLTGQKLLGIPVIVQLTDSEKNRAPRNPTGTSGNNTSVPFHRLYVGNIHFSITEEDLRTVFDPFGELEYVQLQKEETGRSKGYGFVQFRDPNQAKEALEKMNGFTLADRPIRVGLGNDKFTAESTANMMQKNWQGSAFSGSGGRGAHAGGGGGNFDRAGGRDNEKGSGGASALDDTDVAGVNFNNYSRDSLMRKLARTEEPATEQNGNTQRNPAPQPTQVARLATEHTARSKCVVLRNMFDSVEEEANSGPGWVEILEAEIREECIDKYGYIEHCAVDRNTTGDVYIKFDDVRGGENAVRGLNGRFFNGRVVTAQYLVEAVYNSLFSRGNNR